MPGQEEGRHGTAPVSYTHLAGVRLPAMQRERVAQGYPLLAEVPLAGIGTALRAAAETMIPLLAAQEIIRPHEAKLRAFFVDAAQGPEAPVALAEAVLNETAESVEKTAAHLDVPVQVLLFAFSFMLGPVLRALVELSPHGDGKEAPWNVEGTWRQGYCPVCGSGPSIAYLDPVSYTHLACGGSRVLLRIRDLRLTVVAFSLFPPSLRSPRASIAGVSMAVSCQSVEETVSGILARRPVLSPVLQAFAPVSYTHLDVYKRQSPRYI